MKNVEHRSLIDQATQLIAAYVSNNSLPATELPGLIATTHAALIRLGNGTTPHAPEVELVPAVPVKKSVHDDYIICLEDGKQFKSLKRHLSAQFQLTPEAYRQKWNLPPDYPMVAPGYAKQRSALAKRFGLGTNTRGKPSARRGKKVA